MSSSIAWFSTWLRRSASWTRVSRLSFRFLWLWINILLWKQIHLNESIRFDLLEFEIHENSEFQEKKILLEERSDQDRLFTYVLKQAKTVFFSSYYFSGMNRFLRKSTLYINDFSNNEQFDTIYLDYAYELVESVVSHGRYGNNKFLLTIQLFSFNSSY